jgi:hypothetical protein
MTITALPSLDRTSATFKTNLDAYFLTALPTFSVEAEAARVEVVARQSAAALNQTAAETAAALATSNGATQVALATTQAGLAATNGAAQVTLAAAQTALATTQAELAVTIANYKGLWSGLTGALAKPATVSHGGNFWALNTNLADVTASAPGVGSAWTPIIAGSIPQLSKSAAYTLVLSDGGNHILHPSADTTARIFTIPANASVAFPAGTAVTFVNQVSAGVMTIAITSDVMRLAGAGTTGSRTLLANGIATALKISPTEWIISGSNLV